jgi:hypothetical protein
MNRERIRNMVRKRLGDKTAAFWTDEELNNYINDGCRDISYRTKSIKANGFMSINSCEPNEVTQASNEYPLSSNFENIYAVWEVYFFHENKDWIRLKPTIREELDEESPGWKGNVGYTLEIPGVVTETDPDPEATFIYNYDSNGSCPTHYYWDREEDIIGFNPPPDDSNEGPNNVHVYYVKKHVDLDSDVDIPQLPEPLHNAVINYAIAVGSEDRGWGDKANDYWTKYYHQLREYMIERNREREDDEIVTINYK